MRAHRASIGKAARRTREFQLRSLLAAIPESILLIDTEGTIIFASDAFASRVRKNVEDLLGTCVYDAFSANVAVYRKRRVQEAIDTGKTVRFEDRRGGRCMVNYIRPIRGANGSAELLAVYAVDVTDQRDAEEKIRKLNRVYALLSEVNQAIVRVRDPRVLFNDVCEIAVHKGNFALAWIGLIDDSTGKLEVAANAGASGKYLGRISLSLRSDPLLFCPIDASMRGCGRVVCTPRGPAKRLAPCQRLARELGFRSAVSFPLSVSGAIRGTMNFYATGDRSFDEDELALLEELAMDVSFAIEIAEKEEVRRNAEEAAGSLARFPSENPHPVLRIAGDGTVLYANDATAVSLPEWSLVAGNAAPAFLRSVVTEALASRSGRSIDIEQAGHVISFSVAPVLAAGYANLYGVDITERSAAERQHREQNETLRELNRDLKKEIDERKRIEADLRQSEDKFEKAFRTSPDSININRLSDGLFLEINDGFTEIMGYTREDVAGKSSLELNIWANTDDRARLVGELRQRGEMTNLEADFRAKDGTIVRGLMSARVVTLNGEACILTITRDITQRRRAEERIEAALAEKEVLLREIHHRVKNNLQVISSLLSLQAEHVTHDDSRTALRECRERVRSMALVHEKLYRSENLASIHFGEYLNTVTNDLIRSYGNKDVDVAVDMEPLFLQIDKAIPCGLIVNELVSNALVHAFPNGRAGTITVKFQRRDPETVELTVCDNGVGFPEHVDFRNMPSMGMSLIVPLVDQISGTLDLARDAGTAFTIRFPA